MSGNNLFQGKKLRRHAILLPGIAATFMLSSFLYQGGELAESMERGKQVYLTNCVLCHMGDGTGVTGAFPPLAQSDYLMADTHRAIKFIKEVFDGEMKVNGVTYYGLMPAQDLNEKQLSDVINYIRNSWGNNGEIVSVEDVKKALQ